jgi:hypothetical protein
MAITYDKNVSPVGWYIGSFLLRFIEMRAAGNNNLNRRFLSWENTILVRAKSIEHAYSKVVKMARSQTRPYAGGPKRTPVRWVCEGVTELLPIYEKMEDGSELMWRERRPRTLKSLRRLVRSRADFKQLGDRL